MKTVAIAFKLVLIMSLIASTSNASQRPQYTVRETDLSEADLDRLENELSDPATRLAAIAALAEFGSMKLYRVGSVISVDSNAQRDALRERAAKLARTYTDLDTVSRALDSDDPRLQLWGLSFWNGGISTAIKAAGRNPMFLPKEGWTAEEEAWHALMPKIRQLAKTSPYRMQAIDDLTLVNWSENQEFLRSLIPTENSAQVLLQLLDKTDRPNRDARFNEEVLRLLADADVEVRRSALAQIGSNWNHAEVWQVRFSPRVSQRVEELRSSQDLDERRLANFAAEGMEKVAKIWLERDGRKER